MVCARITEIVLRDERAVIPIGVYNSRLGVRSRYLAWSVGAAASRSLILLCRMTNILAWTNASKHYVRFKSESLDSTEKMRSALILRSPHLSPVS